MAKSQETQQLAVEMSGKWGFGGYRPHYGFFFRRRGCPKRQVGGMRIAIFDFSDSPFFTCRDVST